MRSVFCFRILTFDDVSGGCLGIVKFCHRRWIARATTDRWNHPNIPLLSAAMDTVTEALLAISLAAGRAGHPAPQSLTRSPGKRGEIVKRSNRNDLRPGYLALNSHAG